MAELDDTEPWPAQSGAFALGLQDWPEHGSAPRYVRERLLGRGGMGEVWQAWDERLRRHVALKQVIREDDEAMAARLVREARITAALEHPGIVPVHDAGTDDDGRPWYAMRVVGGRTLADALAETDQGDVEPGPREDLLRPVLAACEAVAFAHHAGVVHRDLKPANIQIGAFGETQVMDWGLARPVDRDDAWDEVLSGMGTMTQHGLVLGTPSYMSPEQAAGERADTRSDVWSLGIVLYEVVTGQRAYPGPSSQRALRQVLAGPPEPPEAVQPDAPAELCAIVRRATAVEPAERYPHAGALADDLRAFLDGRRVSAHRYTASDELRRILRRWRLPLLVAAALLVGVGVAGGVGLWRVLGEQARLTDVEAELTQALQTADRRLSEALTQRALLAFEGGDLGRAQLLGVRSLGLGNDPDSRGILADGSGHLRRVASVPVSSCSHAVLSVGALVCGDERGVRLIEADGSETFLSRKASTHLISQPWRRQLLSLGGSGEYYVLDHDPPSPQVAGRYSDHLVLERIGLSLVDVGWISASSREQVFLLGGPFGAARPYFGRQDVCPSGEYPSLVVWLADDDVLAWCGRSAIWRGVPGEPFEPFWAIDGDHEPDGYGVSADGARLAVGTILGRLMVLDLQTAEIIFDVSLGSSRVGDVALSADGAWLAARVPGSGVHVFSVDTGREYLLIGGGRSLGFDRQGRLSVWTGTSLDVWEMPAEHGHDPATMGTTGVVGLSWTESGLAVASGHAYNVVRPGQPVSSATPVESELAVKAAALSQSGKVWIGALDGVFVREPGAPDDTAIRHRDTPTRRVIPMAEDRLLLTGRSTRIVQGETGEILFEEPYVAGVEAAVSPDGRHGLVYAKDREVYKLVLGEPLTWTSLGEHHATAVGLGQDGHPIYLGTLDGVDVLSPDGGRRRIASTGAKVTELAVSPDGSLLAVADTERRIWVFPRDGGEPLARMRGHDRRVTALAFDPAGRWLASGSWDDTVRFWDLSVLERSPDELRADVEAAWGLQADELLERSTRISPGAPPSSPR